MFCCGGWWCGGGWQNFSDIIFAKESSQGNFMKQQQTPSQKQWVSHDSVIRLGTLTSHDTHVGGAAEGVKIFVKLNVINLEEAFIYQFNWDRTVTE